MKRLHTRQRSNVELKMTPLIDVVFLLLVFFVWTASFQKPEYTISTRLSAILGASEEANSEIPPPEEEFDDVVILIRKEGNQLRWEANDRTFESLSVLFQHLQAIHQSKPDLQVILDPGSLIEFGDIIDTYDTARVVGFTKVGFAVSEQG